MSVIKKVGAYWSVRGGQGLPFRVKGTQLRTRTPVPGDGVVYIRGYERFEGGVAGVRGGDLLPPWVTGVPDEMPSGLAASGGRVLAMVASLTRRNRIQEIQGELPQIAPDDKRPCQ